MDPSGFSSDFCRRVFGQDGNTPSTTRVSPPPTPVATELTQPKKSTPKEIVDAWLATSKGVLNREAIKKECIALPAQQNWEMTVYAMGLLDTQTDKLADNVRLLWILQENLETLSIEGMATKFKELKRNNDFNLRPPVESYVRFVRILKALKEAHPGTNGNLEKIKATLPRWEFYFLKFQELMGASNITSRPQSLPRLTPLPLSKFILELHIKNQTFLAKFGDYSCLFWPISPFECCFEPIFSSFILKTNLCGMKAAGYGPSLQFSGLSKAAQEEFQQSAISEYFTQKIRAMKVEFGDQHQSVEMWQKYSENLGIKDEEYADIASAARNNPAAVHLFRTLGSKLKPAEQAQFIQGLLKCSNDLDSIKRYLGRYFTQAEVEEMSKLLA